MKFILFSMGIVALLLVGYVVKQMVSSPSVSQTFTTATVSKGSNVSEADGEQIIEIRAKGGYQPNISFAKAGIPTVLKFNTQGTFDCSSAVTIPSMKISKMLPASGITEIAIGNLAPGTLQGTCGMGMYHFEINVQS